MHKSSKANTVHWFQLERFKMQFSLAGPKKKQKTAGVHLACCAWEYLQPEMTDESAQAWERTKAGGRGEEKQLPNKTNLITSQCKTSKSENCQLLIQLRGTALKLGNSPMIHQKFMATSAHFCGLFQRLECDSLKWITTSPHVGASQLRSSTDRQTFNWKKDPNVSMPLHRLHAWSPSFFQKQHKT